jgi:hypothetical protein
MILTRSRRRGEREPSLIFLTHRTCDAMSDLTAANAVDAAVELWGSATSSGGFFFSHVN